MKKINKILVIIQRSNGDVYLSSSLINELFKLYENPIIDLLINEDTLPVGSLLPFINKIHTFSYSQKRLNRWTQEKNIIFNIFKKYDLSINLTASDRSVIYAILAGEKSISAIEYAKHKSWWKKILLSHYYVFNESKHILVNNLQPLFFLKDNTEIYLEPIAVSESITSNIKKKLSKLKVEEFLIFHPSTQYLYKVYPKTLRDRLLFNLSQLNVPIVITGGSTEIDMQIKREIPAFKNLFDLIGETSLSEFIALSELSIGYIGMDTLNIHIAASQNKKIFGIFGPTNLKMWSPWSNEMNIAAYRDQPIQTYGNVTIFQADMSCVACGKAGCNDNHQKSDCLDNINPEKIYEEIKQWYFDKNKNAKIEVKNKINKNPRNVVLYIVYGDDQCYYEGAIFSILTFLHWAKNRNIEIVVLTEMPSKFRDYPFHIIEISEEQKKSWSLNGQYHFRIKNRGLAFVMDEIGLADQDKILFFDADTYFHKNPMKLFDLIQRNQAVFYLNEGFIYRRKRFHTYVENLEGKKITIDDEFYELSKNSELWGSLMVGVMANMKPSIDWADKLMLEFFKLVPSHTIEPFALSESLFRKYKIAEGKNFVSLYSTSRKKEHARVILSDFFKQNKFLSLDEQIALAQSTRIKRSIFIIIKQRLLRLFQKNVK